MILGGGIIRSRGILGGGILRGGIIVTPETVDPLAGLDFAFRGYGLPTGAFQDSALTTAANTDGEPFGGWVDENGVAFIQSTSGSRGTIEDVAGSWSWQGNSSSAFLAKTSLINLPGDFSVFVRQSTQLDCGLVSRSDVANQILRIGFDGTNRLNFYDNSTNYISDTLATARGIPNNIGIIRSAGVVTFYEGVTERGSFSNATVVAADLIGSLNGSSFTTGDIYAVLIATSDMTANLSQINDALNLL